MTIPEHVWSICNGYQLNYGTSAEEAENAPDGQKL